MKKHVRCVYCASKVTRRNGYVKRLNRDKLQRFRCLDCKKSFTLGLTKQLRLSHKQRVEITRTHLEGRTSIRTLARQTGHSKTTVCNVIHEITRNCV